MATIVEHDKRKHEILQKALDVFIEEGFEDVTFQKIADRCNVEIKFHELKLRNYAHDVVYLF